MATSNYSSQLRVLLEDFQNALISYDDYKLKRRDLLNKVDKEYNGADIPESESASSDGGEDSTKRNIKEETSETATSDETGEDSSELNTVVFSALTRGKKTTTQ